MSCAVVWSSKTGNTELLARSIVEFMGDDCVYAGGPSSDALGADRVYVGFWTDKGSCDESIAAFLTALDSQEVFLFGTAGFGGSGTHKGPRVDTRHRDCGGHVHVSGKDGRRGAQAL